jgi:hypothetical protein
MVPAAVATAHSAPPAASTRERVKHTLELVMEGAPGAEALYAQIPALGLRERIATAETPFWCTVGHTREALWHRPARLPIKELHVRCGPEHLTSIRLAEGGLAFDDRRVPVPADDEVVLEPGRQPPPPERDCSAAKPRRLQMKLTSQRTAAGLELRLRAAEIGLDFELKRLVSVHDCWTVHLPRAQRATLHCVSAAHSSKDVLWVAEDQLLIENTEHGFDELGPARRAIRLPCNSHVEWSRFQYRGPDSIRVPYERARWRCESRCEELHHDERGELTASGHACHERCMDAYRKALFP